MNLTEQEQQKIFEDEVRRIARELWPQAEYDGALMISGRERDGHFETDECIHLYECTVSRSKQKANDDALKLTKAAREIESKKHSHKPVQCYFITKDEPTADQRTLLREKYGSVIAISYSQFQGKLIDAASYLHQRVNYPFGSVRNPANPNSLDHVEYIALDLIEPATQALWGVKEIYQGLLDSKKFIVFGDYGSGKSMTLREVFNEIRVAYLKNKTARFPVYLNLRDHFGQTNPAEVLERHARNLGFINPSHLVRAWRAGYVILIIDGFDELTTLGIQGLWKKLHEVRYRAMEVVRRFVKEQPEGAGIILSGREHFFDSARERKNALHPSSKVVELKLNEFNDEQIKRYLARYGLEGIVPKWMPSRPLLVGYLAASGVLKNAISEGQSDRNFLSNDPAEGWDYILEKVCEREADIEAGIDGPTIRRILERLATKARQSQSGLGPLAPEQITVAFQEICGYQPDEKGALLLQRLPGLGIDRADEGTRIFLDEDFADICRVGDLLQFIVSPFSDTLDLFRGSDKSIGGLGVGLISLKSGTLGINSGKLIPAIRKALEVDEFSAITLDLVRISMELGFHIGIPVRIKDVAIPYLEISSKISDFSKLTFVECLFSFVAIDHGVSASRLPKFQGCYIDAIEGRASAKDLPSGAFDENCEFGYFIDAPETITAIASLDLPIGVRVLLAVLKKLYGQSGSGRKENALQRGLDHHSRRLVGDVLHLLQSEGLVFPYKRGGMEMTIWVPDRSKLARVQRIFSSTRTCGDNLIQKASNLS